MREHHDTLRARWQVERAAVGLAIERHDDLLLGNTVDHDHAGASAFSLCFMRFINATTSSSLTCGKLL